MRKTLVFFLCFVLLNCSKNETKIECEFSEKICSALDDLNLNKKKWIDSNITSYAMSFRVSCFCVNSEPYHVTVNENTLDSVAGNDEWGYEGLPLTINKLFDEIEKRIIQEPFSLKVEYDFEYGYPKESFFDMVEMIADDEIGYYISGFIPM
jgi:hypothetical protein